MGAEGFESCFRGSGFTSAQDVTSVSAAESFDAHTFSGHPDVVSLLFTRLQQ
jgi:hypothetical protein